jgi:transposase-like protein
VVRNGALPSRSVLTGIGNVEIQVPKVRDRSGEGAVFHSTILPPYLKRSRSVEELLPWLYLRGISTGDFKDTLVSLLGESARGLSENTICRLKAKWTEEYLAWSRRDLTGERYAYWWADGIYSNVRMDDRVCLLVIVGVTPGGEKELVAVEDGFRESEASWYELLSGLRSRGLEAGPRLAVGDGALGFWQALGKVYPNTAHQRCWVHKTANVMGKLPKTAQPKVKAALQEIWRSGTRKEAEAALDRAVERFGVKHPKAMDCLTKDREELLAYYDFPAEHWPHIRTTNPIESTFSTVRLRSDKMRSCGSRETTLTMMFKLLETAKKGWRRIKSSHLVKDAIAGVRFPDGERTICD